MQCYLQELLPHSSGVISQLGRKESRPIMLCEDCGLIFVPQVSKEEYMKLYETPQLYQVNSVLIGYRTFDERVSHDFEISEVRWKNIQQRVPLKSGNLLDIGCGNGAFARRVSMSDWQVWGVDLDQWTLDCAELHAPLVRFLRGELPDLHLAVRFDVVTFVDSFEHLLDPLVYVKEVASLLRPQGVVVIEMPNSNSCGCIEKGTNWRHIKPREHPFLYETKHISALWGTAGLKVFDVVHTIPGRCVVFLRRTGD